ncbi:unnamed protein product, partial [Mesorhabditis belari]|uniref:Uncharacterized protein n=1 Tax=Mesorhabditis belari TaxID=2138241 RepID=A0AAF3EQW3_9BILA
MPKDHGVVFTITPAVEDVEDEESIASYQSSQPPEEPMSRLTKRRLSYPQVQSSLNTSHPDLANSSRNESSISLHTKEFLRNQIKHLPIGHFRRIVQERKLGSYNRETQFFTDVTTMHGPLRVYLGNKFSTWFWGTIMCLSCALLVSQIVNITTLYTSKPVVSQVSFLIEDSGIQFPVVTFCNFNPIKKSWLNGTIKNDQFPEKLLDYLLQANVEMQALFSNADPKALEEGEKLLKDYRKINKNISVNNFFWSGGFECEEIMKLCSFGGRKFNCCEHADPVLTPLGRCYSLDLVKFGDPWMKKQVAAGEYNGLQVILDTHLEEISYSGSGEESDPVFTNSFENGFRYFVHAPETLSYVASEGISVSPDTRAYTSISTTNYVLLDTKNWGNCIKEWPRKYKTNAAYSAGNCALQCKALFYYERCECVPFMYNLDFKRPTCTPYEMYNCMNETKINNGTDFEIPNCQECAVECESWQYNSFNSYGVGFSDGAINWLVDRNRNKNLTKEHVKENFLAVSVFFKDLTYIQYNQVKGISISETLSDIGGNMGLCFGMSVITCTEILMYLSKLFWITVSKRRRNYLYEKKQKEEEKQQTMDAIASEMNLKKMLAAGLLFQKFDNEMESCDRKDAKSCSTASSGSTSPNPPTHSVNLTIDISDESNPNPLMKQ